MADEIKSGELSEILTCIDEKRNFLLSGGAGSGKTYTLVETIKASLKEHPNFKIACITYTNAATQEIEKRVAHENLNISTIHNFLWVNIEPFQKELKSSLLTLINDDIVDKIKKTSDFKDPIDMNEFPEKILYTEYLDIAKGCISHDELLTLANYMYSRYKRLCNILKDKYDLIFIDEYQDSSPKVIELFLKHINQSARHCVIGLFGDAMQSIYDSGIGDVNAYIDKRELTEILKEENRRNPIRVIELANHLRLDNLTQKPSSDNNAPNMINGNCKEGTITFLYSTSDHTTFNEIKKHPLFTHWDFNDSKKTRVLNLTHKLIAPNAGFEALMDIYSKDPIFALKKNLVNKIEKDQIAVTDEETFESVANKINLKDKNKKSKVQNLLDDPHHCALYDLIKEKPFNEVRKIYIDKDMLLDGKKDDIDNTDQVRSKRDQIISQLFKIQEIIHLHETGNINEFLRKTDFKIQTNRDRQAIAEKINDLKGMVNKRIEEVIAFADQCELLKISEQYREFIVNNGYLSQRVLKVNYTSFQKLYFYLEGYTPFSTQHKIKGEEYENVFVILDNGGWRNYQFELLFDKSANKNTKTFEQSNKLFYVCVTRTKENLVVYYDNPSASVLLQAEKWFGNDNVIAYQPDSSTL